MSIPELFRPLPPKELPDIQPYERRVLAYNPAEIYPRIAGLIDHFKRVQSISTYDMFPKIPGVCSCGCGTILEGRRTRWGDDDCRSFANDVRHIICGYPSQVGGYIRMYYGYGCINGCERKHPDSPLYDNIDIDHIVPVKLGGGGCWLSNYQPLCKPCHKTKTVADFNWKMPKLRKEDDSPFEQLTMAWAP